MIFSRVQDRNQDPNNTLCRRAVSETGGRWRGITVATSEEGASKVSNGSYYYGKVITATPEPVVGSLVPENLEKYKYSFLIPRGWVWNLQASDQRLSRDSVSKK